MAGSMSTGIASCVLSLSHRLLSIRAYGAAKTMLAAEVVQGYELEFVIDELFQRDEIECIHNAKPGCFNCSVCRA